MLLQQLQDVINNESDTHKSDKYTNIHMVIYILKSPLHWTTFQISSITLETSNFSPSLYDLVQI